MVRSEIPTLRRRPEIGRLWVALLVSLLLHLVGWGGYLAAEKMGVWKHLAPKPPAAANQTQLAAAKNSEPPLVFVEVTRPNTEPPKTARYYSSKNSQAANPEPTRQAEQPQINGSQSNVPKTQDATRAQTLQPSAPPESSPEETPQPNDPASLGDLKLRKVPEPKTADAQKNASERPRTLKQAQTQNQSPPALPGQAMRQEGGVRRRLDFSALDVKSTAFGEYDRRIVEAVTQRWYDLLDKHGFAQGGGKVSVRFKLKPDGSVEELRFVENTVGVLCYVCSSAIQEAAPFGKWPSDMQRLIGANFREITFTFYYY